MPGREPGTGAGAGRSDGGRGSTKDGVEDVVRLIVAYARQETLDPVLRQLKALATGIAGAVLLALGTVLLAVGFVRALQAEFGSTGARSTVIVPVPPPIATK